jgi:hypothetical protein
VNDVHTRLLRGPCLCAPIIGALPAADVDTDLVVKVLDPIWTMKTETATRLRWRIESILGWAATCTFRRDEN